MRTCGSALPIKLRKGLLSKLVLLRLRLEQFHFYCVMASVAKCGFS